MSDDVLKSSQTKYYEKVGGGVSTGLLRNVHYNNICTFAPSVAPAEHIGASCVAEGKVFAVGRSRLYIYTIHTHTLTHEY